MSAEALAALRHVIRPSAGEPDGALVLMHGRGADEQDLLPVGEALDPGRRLVVATPGAPHRLPGAPGWHWYGPVQRVGYPNEETFRATYGTLGDWLAAFAEHSGAPIGRTVLGGFSQGTVMAYAMALGKGRPRPAGVLAMSGFLPRVEGFELALGERSGLPVLIEHGAGDPVITVDWGREARDRLTEAGAEVSYHEHPGGHHIDPRSLPGLQAWLNLTIGH